MPDEATLLAHYSLVGGPADMAPRLRRVAHLLATNPIVANEYEREVTALFDAVPPVDIAPWHTLPTALLGDDVGAFNMAVALSAVERVAATHRRLGLPIEHLALTFSWFRAIIEIYQRRHKGISGITHTRTFWFRKHVDGQLFRFGNMEFLRGPVPTFIPADFRSALAAGDEVPTFHYPGGPHGLDPDRIRASFAAANAFWKRTFGHYPKAWACDSWLFNPAWRELIPHTRIAHSIDLFDELPPLPYNPRKPSGLFFVYGQECCDPRDYPVTNSLERAYVTLFTRNEHPIDGCAWVKVDASGRTLFRAE